jgi:hypothetical protein
MNRTARFAVLAAALAAAACSRKAALNYKHCLKLRVGMTKTQMLELMGAPDETSPYVEGKSLPYLKGRTAFEWNNPATMPGPDHVSFSEDTGKIESIRCSNAEITAAVYVEPPAPAVSTAAAVARSTAPAAVPMAVAISSAPSDLNAALAAYGKKNLTEAFRITRPLAVAENADAQLLLGLIYSDEQVHGPEAAAEAQKWFYRASRKKNAEAAYAYADSIEHGGAAAVNVATEYSAAADMRCPAAEARQGLLLMEGYKDVVAKDPEEGLKMLARAADDGSARAALELSDRLLAAKDPVEAYRRALAASKHPVVTKYEDPLHAFSNAWSAEDAAAAKGRLKTLEIQLTPAQRAKAGKP